MSTDTFVVAVSHPGYFEARIETELAAAWMDAEAGVVRVVGEIDMSNADAVFDAVRAKLPPEGDLVIDLAGLELLDCAGLHRLQRLAAELERRGDRLILTSPRPIVLRALEVTGVSRQPNLTITRDLTSDSAGGPGHLRLVRLT